MATRFQSAMAKLPLVAILRGVTSADAPLILEVLIDEGFALIEIPLNSPNPLASIEAMRRKAPAEVFIGAGTVLSAADVAAVADAGGDLVVTPNAEPTVIAAAKARGLICLPGVATPTEAFAVLRAGANGLKAFPAEMIGPAVVKAWRAVIPAEVPICPSAASGRSRSRPTWPRAPAASGSARRSIGPAMRRPRCAREPSRLPWRGERSSEARAGSENRGAHRRDIGASFHQRDRRLCQRASLQADCQPTHRE